MRGGSAGCQERDVAPLLDEAKIRALKIAARIGGGTDRCESALLREAEEGEGPDPCRDGNARLKRGDQKGCPDQRRC